MFVLTMLKPSRKVLVGGLFVVVVLLLCVSLYTFLFQKNVTELTAVQTMTGDLNYGLDAETFPGAIDAFGENTLGTMYFNISSLDRDNNVTNINVHTFNLNTGVVQPLIVGGTQFNARPISESSVSMIAPLLNDAGVAIEMPVVLDTTSLEYKTLLSLEGHVPVDVVPSPGGKFFALTFATNYENNGSFTDWQIVVFDTTTDTSIIIPEAKSPQWLSDESGFVFLQRNGVYQYSEEKNTASVVYAGYQNISTLAEITLSPNDDYIVMTQPLFDLISVLAASEVDTQSFVEVGRIQTPGQHYTKPVFSPDGQYYAAVAFNNFDFDKKAGLYAANTIEVRHVLNKKILHVISLKKYIKGVMQLTDWSLLDVQTAVLKSDKI